MDQQIVKPDGCDRIPHASRGMPWLRVASLQLLQRHRGGRVLAHRSLTLRPRSLGGCGSLAMCRSDRSPADANRDGTRHRALQPRSPATAIPCTTTRPWRRRAFGGIIVQGRRHLRLLNALVAEDLPARSVPPVTGASRHRCVPATRSPPKPRSLDAADKPICTLRTTITNQDGISFWMAPRWSSKNRSVPSWRGRPRWGVAPASRISSSATEVG